MAWVILLASAVCEAVWATALGNSNGFTEPVATVVFAVGLLLSMAGLGRAMRDIPIGTAYAVWVGAGAALTVTWAIATGAEAFSIGKVVFIAGIVAAVVGLKLVPAGRPSAQAGEERGTEGDGCRERDDEGGQRHDAEDRDVAEDGADEGGAAAGGEADAIGGGERCSGHSSTVGIDPGAPRRPVG